MLYDMTYQLLNISFDTDEWDDKTLDDAINDVMVQLLELKRKKESKSVFDTTFNLWDLLVSAYDMEEN